MTIPTTIAVQRLYNDRADRDACSIIAARRQMESVALILVSRDPASTEERTHRYRTVILTAEEEAEAERLPYSLEAGDGPTQVANRHLRDGETLISVY